MLQILERVERWATALPSRVAHAAASAGSTATTSLTYRELSSRAVALARHLAASNAPEGAPIIVLGHKEPEMLVGFLGALESGRPYIPLDDSLPAHRVQSVARASGAGAILTPPQIAEISQNAVDRPLARIMQPDEPVYIIYTSGSTGEPKGVIITAECVDAFLTWMLAEHPFAEGGETFLNQAPFSFDLSVMDLYASWFTGGTLFSITRREVTDFRALYRALFVSEVSTWVSTPSFVQMCLAEKTFSHERMAAVRRFLFCGETLLPETAARLLDRFPNAEVWNTYGPTEATVATTSVRVTRELLARGGPLPIGLPRPGTDLSLLNDGIAAADGERGEIVLTGPNVSSGYFGRPDLTANAFYARNGQRAYRTGDWGRKRDGLFYCEGRQDLQLKLNGHRIELADIEANFCAIANVRDCVVVPVIRNGAAQSLTAFVALSAEHRAEADSIAALRAALAERVPAYMLPRKIVLLPFLPMTANGKADRQQLNALANPT